MDEQTLKSAIISGLHDDIPPDFSRELNMVIRRMLTVDPNHKLLAGELLAEGRIRSIKEKIELKFFPKNLFMVMFRMR